ncbi:MAG: N-acetylmuramic acid 6-phosphate etherase [Sphingomonadaceae bacterium]
MSSTEAVIARFAAIDQWPSGEAVEAMLEGQMAAIAAIKSQTTLIAAAADAAAAHLAAGGRIIYAGAGTSGRIAVQDGVELGPTFGWPVYRLSYLIAGGMAALARSVEGAEDDADAARADVARHSVGPADIVIGIAASGRTPFTIAVIEASRAAGALTIAIANNPDTPLLAAAHHALLADTGPELVAGSTRMKAGTAQKAIVNMLSTTIMLRLGRVYQGLMVDMVISNDKLLRRALAIIRQLAGCSESHARDAIDLAGRDIKAAVLIAMGQSPEAARLLLIAHQGILRDAVAAIA